MKETKFAIKTLTPSLNKLLNMHFRERMRLKERLAWEVYAELNNVNPDYEVCITPQKLYLIIISHRKSFLDKDNFIGGLKVLIDVIKDLRLIYDDSPEFLTLRGMQMIEKKRKNQRTEISIYRPSP